MELRCCTVLFNNPVINRCAGFGESIDVNFIPGNTGFCLHLLDLNSFVVSTHSLLPFTALGSASIQDISPLHRHLFINILCHKQPAGCNEVVGKGDLLYEFVRSTCTCKSGGGAFKAVNNAGRDGRKAFGKGHRDRCCTKALNRLDEEGCGGGTELHALKIFRLIDVCISNNRAITEGIVGIKDMDILLCETIQNVFHDV